MVEVGGLKLRAERKAGEMLGRLKKKPRGRTDLTSGDAVEGSEHAKAKLFKF